MKRVVFCSVVAAFVVSLLFTACGGSRGGGLPTDLADNYCVAEFGKLTRQADGYHFRYYGMTADLTGSMSGDVLTLEGQLDTLDIVLTATMNGDRTRFTGPMVVTFPGEGDMTLNVLGQAGVCAETDVTGTPPAQFVATDFVALSDIEMISLFRSSAGHDYSDDFETCRSMKHYFSPYLSLRQNLNTVEVFAPVDGVIVHLNRESGGADDGVTNQQVIFEPTGQPAYRLVLFHIDLNPQLMVGDMVTAGQSLGYAHVWVDGEPSHDFDVAVSTNTTGGVRLVSWFQVITSGLFDSYIDWGATERADFLLTETQRDNDPISCTDGQFDGPGTLPQWFVPEP